MNDEAAQLLARKPFKVVAVALANKMARIAWALLAKKAKLQTPAQSLAEIRDRAQLVLEMFSEEIEQGEPVDNRHRLMLAALVHEIRSPLPDARGRD